VRVGGLYTFESKAPQYRATQAPLYVLEILYTMKPCQSHTTSVKMLGARRGKRGCTVLAGNIDGDVFVFSLAAVRKVQPGNIADWTSIKEKTRSTMEKLYKELRELAHTHDAETHTRSRTHTCTHTTHAHAHAHTHTQ
jgi:hypothetical protein